MILFILACMLFVNMCPDSGMMTLAAGESEEWTCPSCGQTGNSRKFCRNCGKPRPEAEPDNRTLFQTPGSIVTFGTYPQTKSGDDKTPIEWLVLDVQDGKSLLLSRYGLDVRPYNTEWKDVTWETCTLRGWLNGAFLNQAFTQTEQAAIINTTMDNGIGQCCSIWNTDGGKNTTDRIFLLSYAEAAQYLEAANENFDNIKPRVQPTPYAVRQGAYTRGGYKTADGTDAGRWWLRSPGLSHLYAAIVQGDGSLNYYNVNDGSGMVRPALWISQEADIF